MKKKRIITIVTLALSVLGALIIWACRKADQGRALSHCLTNMNLIVGAKVALAEEDHLSNGTVVTRAQLANYIRGGWKHFDCYTLGGDEYSLGVIGEDPSCPSHGRSSDRR